MGGGAGTSATAGPGTVISSSGQCEISCDGFGSTRRLGEEDYEEAWENMLLMVVTLSTLQRGRSALKASAPLNMCCMPVTLATFQLLSGWLNALFDPNVVPMRMTLLTFHLDRSPGSESGRV